MRSMDSYSKAGMERTMKIQEVLLRAMARKITWFQAAEILRISERPLRRIRESYEKFGYFRSVGPETGRPSPRRVPVATLEKVMALHRKKHFDLTCGIFTRSCASHMP